MEVQIPYVPAPPGKPWRTDSELAMVRDWFYPERFPPDPYAPLTGDTRQMAADRVRLYIFNDRRTPHALVATAYLAEALVHDQQPDRKIYIRSVPMTSIYGMAFVKFVNGFVDRDVVKSIWTDLTVSLEAPGGEEDSEDSGEMENEQERVWIKGGGESSMYAYAAKIGLPESFVDLRHRIVHGQVPEPHVLKRMTEQGMEWLWEKWWKIHATGDSAKAIRAREERQSKIERAMEEREEAGERSVDGE